MFAHVACSSLGVVVRKRKRVDEIGLFSFLNSPPENASGTGTRGKVVASCQLSHALPLASLPLDEAMAPSSGEASGANYMRTSFLENIQSVIFRRSPTKEPPATSSPSLAPNSSSRPGSDRRGEQQLQRQGEEEEEDKEDVASQASLATATPGTVGNTAVANTQSRVGLHLEPSTSPLTPMSTAAPNTQGASTVGRAEQPPAPLQTASTVSPSRPGKERHTVEDPNDEDSPVKRQRVTSAPELIQDVPSSSQRGEEDAPRVYGTALKMDARKLFACD